MTLLGAAFALAFAPHVASSRLDTEAQPPTIGKVVDFLGQLLSKSQAEGEAEQEIFAKFKCYCDDNEKSKSSEVKQLTEDISKLESQLEGLQAANGELSTQSAKLKTDIADNEASQSEADGVRSSAAKEFEAEKADLEKAIAQMTQAMNILGAVGADQTQSSGEDHAKFMAGFGKKKSASFLGLDTDVKRALQAASSLLPPEQRPAVDSFIQAPFTGSYSSQSAGVMGILKSMRETFESNLQSAEETEGEDAKAHAKLMENLEGMETEMKKSYEDKQEELGENDAELAAKKLQLKSAKTSKESAEEFLDKLLPMCEKKSKEFQARKMLRVNEEASISQAVNILGSDGAFKTFAQASDAESFLQMRAEPKGDGIGPIKALVQRELARAAALTGNRLDKLVALVQSSNPFSVVLTEVDKMVEVVAKEQSEDETKHAFCKKETDGGKKRLEDTNDEIDKLEEANNKLEESVEKPQTGLKAQEDALEKAMQENVASQGEETDMRKVENVQYQKNVDQLVKAEVLLERAVKILKKFYSSLNDKSGVEAAALLQQSEDPAPPGTWKGPYKGQSGDAEGEQGAIGMLKFIIQETQKQNTAAHKQEEEAQADYEDSMTQLKKEQADQQTNMVKLIQALAKAEQEMIDKRLDLKQAKKDKKAVEGLLADIKPGCDFIFDNFELRTKNRKLEINSLVQAKTLLKSSPAYQSAIAEVEADALGVCKSKCIKAPAHVNCKACLAHVSVPGYCAGHAGTPGC
jgi:chromosome segregation ATPase